VASNQPVVPIRKPPPTLASAIRSAVDLGPAGKGTTVSLSFSLKVRNQKELDRLLGQGAVVSPAAYEYRLVPD